MLIWWGDAPANGPALQTWRRGQGWTQRQAAEWYGVHERTWRKYERTIEDGWMVTVPDRLTKRITEYNQLKREQREKET